MTEIPIAPQILIASNSLDMPSLLQVTEKLEASGYEVVAYEADKVADGTVSLSVTVDKEGGLTAEYAGRDFMLGSFAAAWMRRPNTFGPDQANRARQLSMDTERQLAQQALWGVVPAESWLNHPDRMRRMEYKLAQLALAQQVGFTIPDVTVVTNDWSVIHDTLPPEKMNEIICKPFRGEILQGDDGALRMPYTAVLANDLAALPRDANPYPGIWQPRIQKRREWRITVVGDNTFAASIYTDVSASDDWRRHQFSQSLVRFAAEDFPDEERTKCRAYLKHAGLRFGAFDFIEQPNGEITFLECNTNGQYGWLEKRLGLPISEAIASELIDIAGVRSVP